MSENTYESTFAAPPKKSALQGPSTAPATKSALQGPQSTAPATKSALQGLQSTAPATKSALQGPQKHCACHELCTSRSTKYCACHEICASRSTECSHTDGGAAGMGEYLSRYITDPFAWERLSKLVVPLARRLGAKVPVRRTIVKLTCTDLNAFLNVLQHWQGRCTKCRSVLGPQTRFISR